jgi:hypothetical protein
MGKAQIISSGIRNKTGYSLSLLLLNMVLDFLAKEIRQEKEI